MITKNLGMLLLAIYLILVGITALFPVAIPAIVIGILALIAYQVFPPHFGRFDLDRQID